ncbi:hypothetical protein RFI_04661, partial [Reticulomyxa filosa]
MVYLWPFSAEQMHGYIEKFIKTNKKNKMNENADWSIQKYEETLKNYPNLQKMVEEPFLLRLILTVLPLLMKQHSVGTKISKAQVYEAFNEQWVDIHVQTISMKLTELRIQTDLKKIKSTFQTFCQDLGFDMFLHGNQVATETEFQHEDEQIWNILDPKVEKDNKHIDEKTEMKTNKTTVIPATKAKDIWEKYFSGDRLVTININFYISLAKNFMQHKKFCLIFYHGDPAL